MKGKFFLVCLFLAAASACRAGAAEFPASDARITWVGRTEVQGSDVSFDWSGVYAIVRFFGDELRLRASDNGKDYFNVWLDEMSAEPFGTFCLQGAPEGFGTCYGILAVHLAV